jgi:8-oxo-dGTP pyrophosphatase MutT (NUDIX family)
MNNLKYAVQAVIFNEKGEVLAVSRKDNHEDFGLPGGKMDPTDESIFDALQREVKEETGLTVFEWCSELIFSMHKDGYMGYTYLCKQYFDEDDFGSDEPHVIKWTNFETICNGSFGKWNRLVSESLDSMGVKYLKD